jgi:hypothetical protein
MGFHAQERDSILRHRFAGDGSNHPAHATLAISELARLDILFILHVVQSRSFWLGVYGRKM